MNGSPAWAVERSRLVSGAVLSPPKEGPDVCRVCHGWVRPGYRLCFSCRITMGAVTDPCGRVSVISLYRPGSPLHEILRGYKDEPGAAGASRAERLGALIARHLWENGAAIAPEGWDALAVVPSTAGRPGPHPLEAALATTFLGAQLWPGLLAPGPVGADHRRADDRAFSVTADVRGARLVVVDDTWTTGARAQSAASALQRAGASVETVVVAGRVVTPISGAPTGAWWRRHGPAAAKFRKAPAQENRLSSPTGRPDA